MVTFPYQSSANGRSLCEISQLLKTWVCSSFRLGEGVGGEVLVSETGEVWCRAVTYSVTPFTALWNCVPGGHRHYRSHQLYFSLRPFSYSHKKKDEKESRRSARGRFFREPPQGRKWELGGLRAPQACPYSGDGRITTEKPPTPPPDGREGEPEGPPYGFAVVPPIDACFVPRHV